MMVNRIKRNENLEDIMDDYAKTLNIDDVSYFSEIFRYAKRSGGDIPAIIKQTTKMIMVMHISKSGYPNICCVT